MKKNTSNSGEKSLEMEMRPSQGTHKTWQKETAAGGGIRRLMEVPQSRNCQKKWIRKARGGPSEGWISKTALDELGDGIAAPESGSRAGA